MEKRVIVFVGSVGTGKSTLINKLRGKDEAPVSHKDDEDGTVKIVEYTTDDPSLSFIDTPGLDSANFPSHVVEEVQNLNKNLMIVFVTSKRNVRVTCMHKFKKILEDLIGSDGDFCSIQTFSDLDVREYSGFLDKLPKVHRFKDSELDRFRASFSNLDLFHTPKAKVAKVRAEAAKSAIVPMVTKKNLHVKKEGCLAVPLGFPVHVDEPEAFNIPAKKKELDKFYAMCDDVVKLKMEGSREYQKLKLMGDAYLKPIVYGYLFRHGVESLESTGHKVIDNSPESAMPKFFDKFLAAKHNIALPNEKDKIDSHAKSDVVEALLELARRSKKAFPYEFIVNELLILAGIR